VENKFSRRGQMTIFVVVAILIVIGILAFFVIRGNIGESEIPESLRPVFQYYESCIEQDLGEGLEIAGTQGGRIDVGDYEPGSEYAPFSNHLNFLGVPVQYWSYVSGNGIIKENVPGKGEIEDELAEFVKQELVECDFSVFEGQGFEISRESVKNVEVKIEDQEVRIIVEDSLSVAKENDRAVRNKHELSVQSRFGRYYDLALEVYNKQKGDAFLENYGVDVLRNYAPVDGTEISCSPKIWKTNEIESDLKSGLEANIGKIKLQGDYYDLNKEEDKYFVVDLGENVRENIQFMYSRNWPTKIGIDGEGVDQDLIVAEAVGNQEGLGVMGFCYVPYHYVYDLSFPVLIQIFDNEDIFQFPVAVIINNNLPRNVEFGEDFLLAEEEFDLCEFKNQDIEVNVFDVNLNRVSNADISYECLNQRCRLGESEVGKFVGEAPSCVGGQLFVRAEGFKDKKQEYSSNEERFADIVLDREHEVSVEVDLGGRRVEENVLVTFSREDGAGVTAILPDVKSVKLSEGQYNIRVYAYSDSEIVIPGSKKTECRDLPREGILGIFGSTKEECFDISIPETKIESSIIGGGQGNDYFLESELQKGKVVLFGRSLNVPKNLEELQNNFAAYEAMKIGVNFENA
jgi:hypothetical protein